MINEVLRADESVGRYIARAGFSASGFAEWLEAKKPAAVSQQPDGIPDERRIAAFMRGYSSEQYSRRNR